jgi:hypothetical protein
MATPNDIDRDTERGIEPDSDSDSEYRSAAPGTQDQANAGARGEDPDEVAPRTAWSSAAPGAQGEANTQARLNRRWW